MTEDTMPIADTSPHVKDGSENAPKETFLAVIFDYVEILVLSIAAVLVIFTLFGRLCRVNGSSMRETLHNGEVLFATSIGDIEAGDIVVFHQTSLDGSGRNLNEPLVKRVIATAGQTVRIDYFKGEVSVNGAVLDEPYVALIDPLSGRDVGKWLQLPEHDYDAITGIFEATVPDGCCFVMGDNRNNSADSRSREVGFVDVRRILGRVVLRIKPYTVFD